MALSDTITSLGTSIINLVGTRAKTDLSNITSAGETVISNLASGVPVGTVIAYMGSSAPSGFLLMDGRTVSRTTYADLFAVVGTSMGAGDGSTTFGIADMTDGRYLMGSTVAGSSEQSWAQPIIVENGIMGGSYFAVQANNEYNATYAAWKVFDAPTNNTYWESANVSNVTHWYTFYNPTPLKVSNLSIKNAGNVNYAILSGTLQASNDNTNWTNLATISNSVTAINTYWDISVPVAKRNFYKYYRLYNITSTNGIYITIGDIKITATYMYALPAANKLPVHGNGNVLGLTNGSAEYTLGVLHTSSYAGLMPWENGTGCAAGTTLTGSVIAGTAIAMGVSVNPQYSGLTADLNYCNTFAPTFCIKY